MQNQLWSNYKMSKNNIGELKANTDGYLTGKLILAMPSLTGSPFEKAVIYICSHDKNGAMGVIINRPLPSVNFEDIILQLKLETKNINQKFMPTIHFGGPVDITRGFILHSTDNIHKDTIMLNKDIGITATTDMLRHIIVGDGPEDLIFMLGYAGWGEGQLETEIQLNSWLVANADTKLLFHTDDCDKWEKALEKIGITPLQLSNIAGTA